MTLTKDSKHKTYKEHYRHKYHINIKHNFSDNIHPIGISLLRLENFSNLVINFIRLNFCPFSVISL